MVLNTADLCFRSVPFPGIALGKSKYVHIMARICELRIISERMAWCASGGGAMICRSGRNSVSTAYILVTSDEWFFSQELVLE
jgi:hypothetical protein